MIEVLGQTSLLVLCGVLWRVLKPFGLDAQAVRRSLTSVVYVLLLPALVLLVLWTTPLDTTAIRIALCAAGGIGVGLSLAWIWFRLRGGLPRMVGALLLASGFANVTYLGLPVLEATLGPWARGIAIQYDLFASTPLLLTVGIWLGRAYGGFRADTALFPALLREPPLWAAVLGVGLNLANVPMPSFLERLLSMMATGVVPLMLISVGLALSFSAGWWRRLPLLLPVFVIQLLLMPVSVWGLATGLELEGQVLTAVVLEAAMPSMTLGIALCDRFRLATDLYAEAFTLSTALSLFTLPLWYNLLANP